MYACQGGLDYGDLRLPIMPNGFVYACSLWIYACGRGTSC